MTPKDQIEYVRGAVHSKEFALQLRRGRIPKTERSDNRIVEIGTEIETLRAILESLEIVEAVNELRENEGATVTIPSENPEPETPETRMYVTVCDGWTGFSGWQDESFEAKTLLEALRAAVAAKKERAK